MLLTLVGPDRFLVSSALQAAIKKYAPEGDDPAGMNVTRLDGARITPDELARNAQAMGFFSDSRLVIVDGLLTRFASRGTADDGDESGEAAPSTGRAKRDESLTGSFASILAAIPESTTLILVERGSVSKNSALYRAAVKHGKVEEHPSPKGTALERWIRERAAGLGVRITQGAGSALASSLPDLQALANELDKLALYVGDGGTITEATLHEMSYAAKADDVFELTSAISMRDARSALGRLHRLVEGGMAPEGILPVLAWQVRTLITVRDMLDRRVPEARMAEASGLNDFMLRKSIPQARHFTMPKLREVHSRLLTMDHGVKTGEADADLSIDAFVAEMCR
jgi:DNA polymerase III subunit delta